MKRRFSRCLARWLFLFCPYAYGIDAPADKRTLLELAREQFAPVPLTEGEENLFIASERGEEAYIKGANTISPDNGVIRADVLRWLCLNKKASERVTAKGIRISGMWIEGYLDLSDAKLDFPIRARGCAFYGGVQLNGARTRTLDFSGCSLEWLLAHGAEVNGDVLLGNGFQIKGNIIFSGATIAGELNCRGSRFEVLKAEGAKIGQSVDLREAQGTWVSVLGASIGGNLDADGAELDNSGGYWSLLADRAKITGYVFLRRSQMTGLPFRAAGQVNFLAASIGGSLECDGAQLSEPPIEEWIAPNLPRKAPLFLVDRARIGGSIFLRNGFCCDGLADFKGTEVFSVVCLGAHVTGNTELDLQSMKVGVLTSDNTTWPKAKNVKLDGLVYGRLHDPEGIDLKRLLTWLALQPDKPFYPQPYEQLASVLRAMGFEEAAREVMLEKNRQHRKFTRPLWGEWWWYNVFGRFIGYGYEPVRALEAGIVLIVFGACLFKLGYARGLVMPTKENAYEKKEATAETTLDRKRPIAENYPRFNAFIYALESFTPLLRLDQTANWMPNANRRTEFQFGRVKLPISGGLLRCYLWILIIAGWILTSLWITSVTGLVKK